jgi:hypothetical protein
MTSPTAWLLWKGNDSGLIGADKFSLVDGGESLDEAAVKLRIQCVPFDAAITIGCRLEPGDESALRQRLEALPLDWKRVTEWSLELVVPPRGGNGQLNVKALLEVLKPCASIRLNGCVSEGIEAISHSPAHLHVLEALAIEACGSAFSSIDVLKDWPLLRELNVSGANNAIAPWRDLKSIEGFARLEVVRLVSIASLQNFANWVAPSCPTLRRPTVELGEVRLPPGRSRELEFGSHVRLMKGDFEFGQAHWLFHGSAILQFQQACQGVNTMFSVPQRCSAAELLYMLREASDLTRIVCTGCESLARWPLNAWLPETLGMEPNAELLQIDLPALNGWTDRDCDSFVKRLELFVTRRSVGELCVSVSAATARLQGWSCVLKWSGSRVTLQVNSDFNPPQLFEADELHLDLASADHRLVCELLIERGVRAQFFDRVRLGGKIGHADFEFLQRMLESIQGFMLHIDAECHDGAEWLLGGFVRRNRARVQISDSLKSQLQRLDGERRDYEKALEWALHASITS